jgi:hypothetical protein
MGNMRSSHTGHNPQSMEGGGVVVVLGLLAGGVYLAYLLVTGLVLPSTALVGPILAAVVSDPAPIEGLWLDALFGIALGLALGLLRLWLRRRGGRLEAIVEAVARPEVASAARVGAWYVGVHVVAGLAGGAIVGLLGMVSPFDAWAGEELGGPAAFVLAGGAGGAGAGGPPPPEPEHAWFALGLLVFLGTVAATAALTAGLGAFAHAAASGAAQHAGKAGGLALFLALTRLRGARWAVPDPPPRRPPPTTEPLVFEREVERFLAAASSAGANPENRAARLHGYLAWLSSRGVKPDVDSAIARVEECAEEHRRERGKTTSPVPAEFAAWLRVERQRRDPGAAPPDMSKTWAFVFEPGWLGRAVAEGLLVGMATGALSVLATLVGQAISKGQVGQ